MHYHFLQLPLLIILSFTLYFLFQFLKITTLQFCAIRNQYDVLTTCIIIIIYIQFTKVLYYEFNICIVNIIPVTILKVTSLTGISKQTKSNFCSVIYIFC